MKFLFIHLVDERKKVTHALIISALLFTLYFLNINLDLIIRKFFIKNFSYENYEILFSLNKLCFKIHYKILRYILRKETVRLKLKRYNL